MPLNENRMSLISSSNKSFVNKNGRKLTQNAQKTVEPQSIIDLKIKLADIQGKH